MDPQYISDADHYQFSSSSLSLACCHEKSSMVSNEIYKKTLIWMIDTNETANLEK